MLPKRGFLIFALLVGFFISAEYGLTRPVSHALFLSTYSSAAFPYAWLAAIPLNGLVVALYNRYLARIGPLRMLTIFGCVIALLNTVTALLLPHFPDLILFHFLWKDVYILFMFKQLWSMVHMTIDATRARYLYGLFFAVGSMGGLAGNIIPALFATRTGSEMLLLGTLPIYGLIILFYRFAYNCSALPGQPLDIEGNNSFGDAWKLTYSSLFLRCILILVILMQVSSSLFEYQFNWYLERTFADKDLLSQHLGKLMGIVNLASGAIQLGGSFLLVRLFGLRGAHAFIPIFLAGSAILSGVWNSLALVSFSFIAVKAIDYSLFGVLRELLYPSLTIEEKFRAKSVIDVFAYRTSKSIASLLVLALQYSAGAGLIFFLQGSQVLLCAIWVGVIFMMFRQYSLQGQRSIPA